MQMYYLKAWQKMTCYELAYMLFLISQCTDIKCNGFIPDLFLCLTHSPWHPYFGNVIITGSYGNFLFSIIFLN